MMTGYQIGIDVGGTFTDAVTVRESGQILVTKTSSTPLGTEGVLESVRLASQELGITVKELLSQTTRFVYGTTYATNTIIQRQGAKIGAIVTQGFRDTLEIRRMLRSSTWDIQEPRPEPLVPRELVKEVPERINYQGKVSIPLDLDKTEKAVRELTQKGVKGLAICLLHSYRNPEHERLVGAIARKVSPDLYVTASVDVCPEMGEFERMSTTVFNAYIGPMIGPYFDGLQKALASEGLLVHPLVLQSSGGVIDMPTAAVKPVATISSGPAGGVMGARYVAMTLGVKNFLTMDVGGTSFDVGVLWDGEPSFTIKTDVQKWPVRLPMIEITSIGAGGGSIARIDFGGKMRVGPESASAVPGPACYGAGGTEPTLTDAYVVLGLLNPDYFLGGRKKLDPKRAEIAIKTRICERIGLDVVQAASGIFQIVSQNMIDALRLASIKRGFDPRQFWGLIYGGAGATHCSALFKELDMPKIVVPEVATAFSAFGALATHVKFSVSEVYKATIDKLDVKRANIVLERLAAGAEHVLIQGGVPADTIEFHSSLDMNYEGQRHEINVKLHNSHITQDDLEDLRKRFYQQYELLYGFHDESIPVQVVTFRLDAVGLTSFPQLQRYSLSGREPGASAKKSNRNVFFQELSGFVSTPIYHGQALQSGNVVDGPAVIEYPGSTVIVRPEQKATYDEWRSIIIE